MAHPGNIHTLINASLKYCSLRKCSTRRVSNYKQCSTKQKTSLALVDSSNKIIESFMPIANPYQR